MTLEGGTHIEITPEPSRDERAAILAALARLESDRAADRGRWWEAGLRQSVEGEDETA